MSDAQNLVRHANNINVWMNLTDRFPNPYTLGDAREWLKQNVGASPETHFAIEVDRCYAGGIGFRLHEGEHRLSAEIGYWLGEQFWGMGIATEALAAVARYAIAEHNLIRLHARVFEWNPASMRVLEKCGFVREAVLRRSVIKDNRVIDEMIYALVP
jgi:RimJ/RimL family protein N-acetyltransferase